MISYLLNLLFFLYGFCNINFLAVKTLRTYSINLTNISTPILITNRDISIINLTDIKFSIKNIILNLIDKINVTRMSSNIFN